MSQKTGKEWVLYSLDALDEAGQPISAELNAFTRPVLGELHEYEIERKVHERYGESYTLKPKKQGFQVINQRLDYLENAVAELRQQVGDH